VTKTNVKLYELHEKTVEWVMESFVTMLRFAKRGPTWTGIVWMQPLMTQLWSSDTRYNNTRSPLYVRRRSSTSTNIDKR
jgi:hypothetical protein